MDKTAKLNTNLVKDLHINLVDHLFSLSCFTEIKYFNLVFPLLVLNIESRP